MIEPYVVPFTILIDSAEQHPFPFQGLRADADKQYRPLVVPTKSCNLGRHPHSKGDYSIEGLSNQIGIERKSVEDIQGTVLGWRPKTPEREATGRRQRFEKELENLSKLKAALVLVEGNYADAIATMQAYGTKSADTNKKTFNRSVQAYLMDYKVPWHWAGSREAAEVFCFQFLRRFWRKYRCE